MQRKPVRQIQVCRTGAGAPKAPSSEGAFGAVRMGNFGLQTHFLLDFAEGFDSEIDVFLGVTGGNLGADTVLALG